MQYWHFEINKLILCCSLGTRAQKSFTTRHSESATALKQQILQYQYIFAIYPWHGSTRILMYAHLQIIAHLNFLSCGTGVRGWTGSFFKVAYFLPTCTLQGAVHGVLMVLMRLARSQRMSCCARKWLGSPESPGQASKCEDQWWKGRSESCFLLWGGHSVWVPNSNPLRMAPGFTGFLCLSSMTHNVLA